MGNTLAQMQRDLTLIDSDSARDAKEILDRLEEMAQDRIDLFYEKIGYASQTFFILAVMVTGTSASFPSAKCSTSTPISAHGRTK
jgi:hypothetical protein